MTELEYFLKKEHSYNYTFCKVAHVVKYKASCGSKLCEECEMFKSGNEILKILLSEHKEKPKLTDDEKAILRNLPKKCEYIIRNWNNKLFLTEGKPQKKGDYYWGYKGYCYELDIFEHLFQFIKWEDEEPWSIKKLLEE